MNEIKTSPAVPVKPVFSICVPNYNYAHYIGKTLDSVLNQDFTDFEIIIVDNASTDHSWEVIQSYVQRDPRIKAFRNSANIGFAPNLQCSSEKASGDYIIMLSSDDTMEPKALSSYNRIYQSLGEKATRTVLHSAVKIIDSDDVVSGYSYRFRKAFNKADDYFPSFSATPPEEDLDDSFVISNGDDVLRSTLLQFMSPATFCCTAFSRALWNEVGGYDTSSIVIPDSFFLFRLLGAGCDIVYARAALFCYRIHHTNQFAQTNKSGQIKYQIDGNNLAFNYPERIIARLGLTRGDLLRGFIKSYCHGEIRNYFVKGNFTHAFKIYSFSFATSPRLSFSMPLTYLYGAAFLLYPATVLFFAILRKVRS
jgi:glycosyltransferase involved in cell wall biosynthesis